MINPQQFLHKRGTLTIRPQLFDCVPYSGGDARKLQIVFDMLLQHLNFVLKTEKNILKNQ